MTDLVVVVPSRGRPDNAYRLREAFRNTCTTATDLLFVVDNDDTTWEEYPTDCTIFYDGRNGSGMIPALNYGAWHALLNQPLAVGFMGDDHLPRTLAWDSLYLRALEDMGGTGLVYGNDLIQGARIPTQGILSANIIEELGWFAPPSFRHLYVDDAWLAIGNCINRVTYLPDVIVEHIHPMGNKAEWDEGYARVNAPEIASHDQAEFLRWKNMDLREIKKRLERLV